ncbi:MAG: thermonuclease family protein [Bacilli bacterium]|nr:thermonuclease family protein [Bacilli bacterium]
MKKIFIYILTFVFMLGLSGCEMGGGTGTGGGGDTPHTHEFVNGKCECGEVEDTGSTGGEIDNTKVVTDDQLKTPYTDDLKLTASYAGKSFLKDGIGVVTLTNAIDGDTATFKEGGTTFTVRFNAINTPESTYKLEPWGKAAARFTANTLKKAAKIVLQTDTVNTARLDSTGKRYLAWVWYQPTEGADFRLLNLEIVEKSYSSSKASGTMYADALQDADLEVQKLRVRIFNSKVQDPDYDYSETGKYLTIKEIRENAEEYSASNIKVIVRGIVARKNGSYSAYIQQQEDGVWHIGGTSLEIKASEENPDMPQVGENGNWWIGEVDTNIEAVNGVVGQTLYAYYVANLPAGETALDEATWHETLVHNEIDENINYPYIVQDGEWYGIYLYGGFSGQASKLTIGYEVRVGGNFSLYAGSLQITNVNPESIEVINREKQAPHIYEINDVSTLTLTNTQIMNCLVEVRNLRVTGGYNTASSDGFTLYCVDEKGNQINIRVDGNTTLHQTKEGSYVQVKAATDSTGEKGYWSDGVLDADAYGIVNCYEFFVGKTFSVLRGVVGVYDPSDEGQPSKAQVQIMLSLVSDIEFAE